MIEHTPGPWMVAKGAPHFICNVGKWIASTMGVKGEEGEANARLIAAAPELLDALKALMPTNLGALPATMPDSTTLPLDVTFGELRCAIAAIAKATGK